MTRTPSSTPEPLDLSVDSEHHLGDEAATAHLGARIAPGLMPGDVVYLTGELGAGKSTLARGLIRALTHAKQDVPSPTFTLAQFYDTAGFPLLHLDLYRLETPEEVYELGLDEALSTSVLLIEWPQRLEHLGYGKRLDITLQLADKDRPQAGRLARVSPRGQFRSPAAPPPTLQGDPT